jgi:hypothetical protein
MMQAMSTAAGPARWQSGAGPRADLSDKSLDEVKQALGKRKSPTNVPPLPTFAETAYEELTKK